MFDLFEKAAQFAHATHEPIEAKRCLLRLAIGIGGACHLIASATLRQIQRAVGRREQRLQISAAGLCGRDANRKRHTDRAFTTLANCQPVRGHGFAQSISELLRLDHRRVRKKQHEFVAGVAANDVVASDCVAQQAGDRAQHVVALQVPEGIVHRLEVIDVDDGQCHRLLPLRRLVEHQTGVREEPFAQHQSGQIIKWRSRIHTACVRSTRRRGIDGARG